MPLTLHDQCEKTTFKNATAAAHHDSAVPNVIDHVLLRYRRQLNVYIFLPLSSERETDGRVVTLLAPRRVPRRRPPPSDAGGDADRCRRNIVGLDFHTGRAAN